MRTACGKERKKSRARGITPPSMKADKEKSCPLSWRQKKKYIRKGGKKMRKLRLLQQDTGIYAKLVKTNGGGGKTPQPPFGYGSRACHAIRHAVFMMVFLE